MALVGIEEAVRLLCAGRWVDHSTSHHVSIVGCIRQAEGVCVGLYCGDSMGLAGNMWLFWTCGQGFGGLTL